MSITIYGIKNCDTMKKAFKWLDEHSIAYEFHDYKKSGVPEDIFTRLLDESGWEPLINKRGTTWRKLDENQKLIESNDQALALIMAQPSLIKRPVLLGTDHPIIGFSADLYNTLKP